MAVTQGITVGAAAGAAGGAAGAAASAGGGIIGSGIVGGTAGSATSYVGNGLFTGHMSFGEGLRQTLVGGFSGALSAGSAYGTSFVFSQIPVLRLFETGVRAVSSSVSSMATALANGDNILDAGLSGLFWGAMSSEANVLVSLGQIYSINAFGETDALNRFYGTENGEWMTEGQSVSTMKPGDVSASVANDWSVLLSLLSGNGPFSHVRGMDKNNDIVESNGSGVGILEADENHKSNPRRLTYVTKAYRGGQDYGVEARSFLGKGFLPSYVANHLCVGATHKVNPYYPIGSPNGLLPWNQRYFYFYHY